MSANQPDPTATTTDPSQAPTATAAPDQPTVLPSESESASPESLAGDEAVEALSRLLATFDERSTDSFSADNFGQLATGDALEWAAEVTEFTQSQNWVVTGSTVLDDVEVVSVELDADATKSGNPTVEIEACVDVSQVDVLDENGVSVVTAARVEREAVAWAIWQIDGVWLVAETGYNSADTTEVTRCDP